MRRAQRGLTLVELAIAMTLLGGLGLALGAMAIRGASLEREARLSLAAQQELSTLFRRFSSDVREAAVVGTPTPTSVVLRHADQDHVTYRFAGQKLQRGVSSTATALPSSWEDLVDPQSFEVSNARFRFYSEAGVETAVTDAMRRVDLVELSLRGRQDGQERALPELSAALRGNPRSGTLEAVGNDGSDTIVMTNTPSKTVEFALRNRTDQPITVRYFQFAWSVSLESDPLKQFWIGPVKWMDHQKDAPGELPESVTIGAQAEVGVEIHFDDSMPDPLLGTLSLFAPDDVLRREPYLLSLRIVRR